MGKRDPSGEPGGGSPRDESAPRRARDAGLFAGVAAGLIVIAISVTGRLLEPEAVLTAGGARAIDAARCRALIDGGVLAGREALFWKEADPGARATGPGAGLRGE